MPYRPDIDGLRAVAVLAVVAYHAAPAALPGGFVGVDVFFVISGFLISGILQDALAAGHFSLADFYARRVRRIFPALALVLAATLLYGQLVLLPGERALLGRDAAGGAGFVANLVFWSEVGYFDRDAAAKPLLHLWSLGVEEQFYIAWPLLLWVLHRATVHRGGGIRLGPIAFLAAASLATSLALTSYSPAAAFYAPFTRFWEIALGAMLAWAARRPGNPALAHRDAASVAGLALIALALGFVQAGPGFPGWRALPPTIGAALLIAAGPDALVNRRILALRPMVAIGLISYPLYLWHWPLLSYAHIINLGRPPKPLVVAALIAAAFALAWLTWRFIETPIRTGIWRPRAVPALAAAMALLAAIGLAAWQLPNPARDAGLDIARINAAIRDGIFRPTPAMQIQSTAGKISARLGPTDGPGTLLVGDSLLFHYAPRAQALHDANRLAGPVHFVAGPSCAPFPGTIMPPPFTHCTDLAAMTRATLATGDIRTVILGASWPGYLGPTIRVETPAGPIPVDSPAAIDAVFAHLETEVARLRAAGLRVVLILPPPVHPRFDPRRMVARTWHSATVAPDATTPIPLAEATATGAALVPRLRAIAARHGAETRDPTPAICGNASACPPFQDGAPKFSDDKHLRPGFVAAHVSFLDDLLAPP